MRRLGLALMLAALAHGATGCASRHAAARTAGQVAAGLAVAAAAQIVTSAAQAEPEKPGDRGGMTDEQRSADRQRRDDAAEKEAAAKLRVAKRRAAAEPAAYPGL